MGNQSSTSSSSTPPTTDATTSNNNNKTPSLSEIPKLAPPVIPFQELPLSSFRVQELFLESRYCRYLRDVMTTLHYTPDRLKLNKENVQSLYALYWSCLLSGMDKELNTSLPPTVIIDKMASELVMSRFDPATEAEIMRPIAKVHDKYFEKYEQFIDKHFEATQMTQSTMEQPYVQMMERSMHDKLYHMKPTLGASVPAVAAGGDANATESVKISEFEKKSIQSKYDQLVGSGSKPCGPLPETNPNAPGITTTPQQFEEYYRYRMCVIAHMCSPEISKCMKNEEKKGFMDCVTQSESVHNNCIQRLVKSGVQL